MAISNHHETKEEIENILSEDNLIPDDGYKRIFIGRSIDLQEISRPVEAVLGELEGIHEMTWNKPSLWYPTAELDKK